MTSRLVAKIGIFTYLMRRWCQYFCSAMTHAVVCRLVSILLHFAWLTFHITLRHEVRPVKSDRQGASEVISLERGTNDFHVVQLMPLPPIISCFIKIQNGLTFLVAAYPGCPEKEAIKWISLCRQFTLCMQAHNHIHRDQFPDDWHKIIVLLYD